MSSSNSFKLSVCMPIYKGSSHLKEALNNILNQDFDNLEIIIGDDNPPEFEYEIKRTQEIIKSFDDPRIKYFKNKINLGYPKNLQKIVSKAQGDILFLMAQDDLLAKGTLRKTHDAFFLDENIGVVTRPYFWFYENVKRPVRAVMPYGKNKDVVLSIWDGEKAVLKVLESVGQLSGLAYMKKYLEVPFHDDVFPAHIYPFLGIFKKHKCVFLKDFTVAVRIPTSQTRYVSSIYDKPPTLSWIEMFETVLREDDYKEIRNMCIKHYAQNFLGLIQIKNYSTFKNLIREILILLKFHPLNLLDIKFWFFSLGTILIPRNLLIWLVDNYKKKVLSRRLDEVRFII